MTKDVFPITAKAVRYIKLGTGNVWFEDALSQNRISFGHRAVPHEVALRRQKEEITGLYRATGKSASKASDYAREVLDFYDGDERCLWVTFAQGSLWWAFAEAEVAMIADEAGEHGQRARPVIGAWSNKDAGGGELTIASLSTRLTKVAAYRQTICKVQDISYLLRKINAAEEPVAAEARQAQTALLTPVSTLVKGLHWRDFEILCDLIFARSGWQRQSELGGVQKDTDMVLQQSATGEKAFVQVKSSADGARLRDYAERFDADPGFDRMFFVCHSLKGDGVPPKTTKPVHVWTLDEIARQAVAAGLLDWLLQKAG